MTSRKELKTELANKMEHIERLEAHIKNLEENSDTADITESFWEIHNGEMEQMKLDYIKKTDEMEEEHKKIFDEKEVYELCYQTFGHIDIIYAEDGIEGVIRCVKEDIEKRWSPSPKYYIDEENNPL